MANKPQQSLLLSLMLLVACHSGLADSRSERLQAMVEQWLGIEQQADQLRHDWQQQKLVLEQRLQLLQAEKASIKKHLAKHSGRQTKAQQARAELAQQQNQLEQNQKQIAAALRVTHERIQAIAPRLPEPLAQHWNKTLSQPDIHKSNSEKLDRYLGLLKAMDEFDQKITRHQSLMEINGQQVLVDQVYLGLGQGWYLSRDGQLAGIGRAGEENWQWQANNQLAPMLKDVVIALKQPEKARLLPIQVELSPPLNNNGAAQP